MGQTERPGLQSPGHRKKLNPKRTKNVTREHVTETVHITPKPDEGTRKKKRKKNNLGKEKEPLPGRMKQELGKVKEALPEWIKL